MGIKVIWKCDFCGNQQQIDEMPEEGQEARLNAERLEEENRAKIAVVRREEQERARIATLRDNAEKSLREHKAIELSPSEAKDILSHGQKKQKYGSEIIDKADKTVFCHQCKAEQMPFPGLIDLKMLRRWLEWKCT